MTTRTDILASYRGQWRLEKAIAAARANQTGDGQGDCLQRLNAEVAERDMKQATLSTTWAQKINNNKRGELEL